MATIKGGPNDKLKKALGEIGRKLGSGSKVRVGFLEGATYPDGKPVALVAAWNEFGTATAPPRPFFRNMIAAKKAEWPKAIAGLLPENSYDVHLTLDQAGFAIAGQLSESITTLMAPELRPITVMLRGMRSNDPNLIVTGKTVGVAARRVAQGKTNYGASTKPLVDSSVMLRAVDHEVVDN